MIRITDKIIALTSDGSLIIFANRDEFAGWASSKKDFEVWATPNWLLRRLQRQEKKIEECYNEINKLNENTPHCNDEFPESVIRAIKAREDERQQKIAEELGEGVE